MPPASIASPPPARTTSGWSPGAVVTARTLAGARGRLRRQLPGRAGPSALRCGRVRTACRDPPRAHRRRPRRAVRDRRRPGHLGGAEPLGAGTLTRERFDARHAARTGGDDVEFVVDVEGRAVGTVALFGFDAFARHAEAGISLLPGARSRGIGTAALVQLVEFGFTRRNLHRIHLQAIASNTGGLRAYEKAGFVLEGRLREHAWVRGGYEDIVLMGILAPRR
ncbi:GNAT family N-acetyltransferase [Klenkia terrae]|uniref:GNAT family N-acetyltransferase n=1 Tax=Klenkia terrae TaxID=1052259 RepID=UPI003613BE5D